MKTLSSSSSSSSSRRGSVFFFSSYALFYLCRGSCLKPNRDFSNASHASYLGFWVSVTEEWALSWWHVWSRTTVELASGMGASPCLSQESLCLGGKPSGWWLGPWLFSRSVFGGKDLFAAGLPPCCIRSLYYCCGKIPNRSNLRRDWSLAQGYGSSWWQETAMGACAVLSMRSQIPGRGMVPPTCRMAPPTSVYLI